MKFSPSKLLSVLLAVVGFSGLTNVAQAVPGSALKLDGACSLSITSTTASGVFSLELWGMPFYGAKSGSVVFSRGGGSVAPGDVRSFWLRYESKSLGMRRFGVISLFEYTSAGWVFADDVKSTTSVKF